jgi:hypothetical protein
MTDILEPAPSEGLHPALKDFFAGAPWRRVGRSCHTVEVLACIALVMLWIQRNLQQRRILILSSNGF